jgi:phospholipid/cholesterol/gamma-HCH transport system substrate-binding protein
LLDYRRSEIVAGAFVLAGLALLGYLSLSIGGVRLGPRDRYRVLARFSNIGDLKLRAPIKIAGVTVGEVKGIRLADYFAEITLEVDRAIALPTDTIASISTAGLLGEAYVALSPGAADGDLRPGDRITRTEPALNVADLIGRYAFGGGASGQTPSPASDGGAVPSKPEKRSPPIREEKTP